MDGEDARGNSLQTWFLSNLYATNYLVSFKNIPLWLTFRGIILKNILFEMIGMTGKQLCSSFNNFAERSIFLLKLLFPKVKKEMELSKYRGEATKKWFACERRGWNRERFLTCLTWSTDNCAHRPSINRSQGISCQGATRAVAFIGVEDLGRRKGVKNVPADLIWVEGGTKRRRTRVFRC